LSERFVNLSCFLDFAPYGLHGRVAIQRGSHNQRGAGATSARMRS
jgi:hypothetical protein